MITDLMQGTSLPSSVLTINVSAAAWTGAVLGATSPPHLLTVERRCLDCLIAAAACVNSDISRTTTTLELAWNPPAITHPEDQIFYRVFYR